MSEKKTFFSTFFTGFFIVSVLFGFMVNDTAASACRNGATGVPAVWLPLFERLVKDGEDPSDLKRLFSAVTFDKRVMPRKLKHKERPVDYEKFLQPKRISRARAFLARNRKLLEQIEKRYHVPKEVMTSIFLIETDLGRYLGAGPAFRILASMALASDFDAVRPWLPDELLGRNELETRRKLRKKAQWAYSELRALIEYARENHMDPLAIKGSIFGAIGLCQFMPSNALRFGIDFDNDERVDLFHLPDAAASMANYLSRHGWKREMNHTGKIRVLLSYNYSRPYAKSVLEVASRL